jgi:hypothetical protein
MKQLPLVIIFVCVLSACYNDDLSKHHDVYLIGGLGKTVENGADVREVAYCWVNGKPISLTDTTINAYTSDIVVSSDNEVYNTGGLAKAKDDGFLDATAVYWKNGKVDTLVYGNYAGNVIISNNDIYIAGSGVIPSLGPNTIAMYWKNGQPFPVADASTQSAAVGIAVSKNNDVYTVGYTIHGNGRSAACWKNGKPIAFAGASDYTAIKLCNIAIADDDVYIAGNVVNKYGTNYAAYWKNNKIVLQDSTNATGANKTFATDITVSGKDVYVAGGKGGSVLGGKGGAVCYWKNGEMHIVETIDWAESFNLVVTDGDIYIAGYAYTNHLGDGYWKNGQWSGVSKNSATAKIFVR